MKRVFTLLGLALVATVGFNNQATAQVEQGNIIIDPYVGIPTSNLILGSISGNADFSTVGPPVSFGARAEFMAADNFGVGLDVNYVMTGYQYTESDYYYDETTMTFSDANYKYRANRLRAMVRLNYHFVQDANLDAYFGVGAGYRNVKRSIERDGVSQGDTGATLIPVSFRIALGGRYHFTDNLGAMLELGLGGGGPIQFGLSLKF